MKERLIIHGDLFDTAPDRSLRIRKDHWITAEDGVIKSVSPVRPENSEEDGTLVRELPGLILMPGLIDLHVHAPQFNYRGLGMDLELLDWLDTYTFPEEARFRNTEYAAASYRHFADAMRTSFTTRAAVFATVHTDATLILASMMEETGIVSLIGKVNMDRNAPDIIAEPTEGSERETLRFVAEMEARARDGRFKNTSPILTPRFTPSCTDELMKRLGEIQERTGLPVQSHLSENRDEVRFVKELCPDAAFYGETYARYGLFGDPGNGPGDEPGKRVRTVMAHCVYSGEEEIALIRRNGVFIAHCPNSNMNVSSGIAPVRRYLSEGIRVGLGTDVAGGFSVSVSDAMVHAIQVSKLYRLYVDRSAEPLSVAEAFYLATRGGGEFFGKTGAFEPGYELDLIALDDSTAPTGMELSDRARFERTVYLSHECTLRAKYVRGRGIRL